MTNAEGWVAPGWEGVRAAFERNFEKGAEVGAAFAAYHRGLPVVDLWGGVADLSTGTPWKEDTVVLVYSTTKGLTAMCANRLADEGSLDVSAPVREYWPEFAASGKGSITVADLLAHRAGLAWTDEPMTIGEVLAWEPVIRSLEAQAPHWEPGTAHGYHATTYGWLVGEVVRRVSGRSVGSYLRDEIAGPLGADCWIGLPESQEHRVARLVQFTPDDISTVPPEALANLDPARADAERGPRADGSPPIRNLKDVPDLKDKGLLDLASEFLGEDSPLVKALTSPGGALGDESSWNSRELRAAEIPAANGVCEARGIARLYSSCLDDVPTESGDDFRVFSPKQLDQAVHQETEGPDRILFGIDIQWGLGFMISRGVIAEAKMGGPRSFGHFGLGGSIGWADPDSRLAMGYVMNKLSMGMTGDARGYRLVQACREAAGNL